MLHYLDDLDSKMESMRAHFERGGDSEGFWTGFNPSLGRPLLNPAKFLEKTEKQPPVPSPAQASEGDPDAEGGLAQSGLEFAEKKQP
jgi:hypothetical protein